MMKHKITTNGFPTLTISKMNVGDMLYAERNSMIASSPIYDKEEDVAGKETGGLIRRVLTQAELEGQDDEFAPKTMHNHLSQAFENFMSGSKRTINRQRMGEKSYVLYKAIADGQKVTFRSCFPGTIFPWNATPLQEGEFYTKDGHLVKSIWDEGNEPHGAILMVSGSFLAADFKVKAKIYRTGDVNVLNFSGTKDRFQRFSGEGFVFCEVHGDLQEIPLYPGESVDVYPGYLLGFTEGTSLSMHSSGDVLLRNKENNDYVIRLTAGERGGYVYVHSVNPDDFFRRHDQR